MGLLEFLSPRVGIDLGTANTRVCLIGRGIVVQEPSVIARSTENQAVLAIGQMARRLQGKHPANVWVSRPLRESGIADLDSAYQLLHALLTVAQGRKPRSSRFVFAVPHLSTSVERRALLDIAQRLNAKEVLLVEAPIAAAIGADLPIDQPLGNMIVDIGAGTTEVAVISLMGLITSYSDRVAGDHLDQTIRQALKRNYDLLIGEQTAQHIKQQLGSAHEHPQWDKTTIEVGGRSIRSGLPTSLTLKGAEVRDILQKDIALIIRIVQQTLQQSSPEIISDLMMHGLMLSGGGALLKGIDTLISQETGLFVHVAPHPLDCVVRGLERIIEDHQRWNRVLIPVE